MTDPIHTPGLQSRRNFLNTLAAGSAAIPFANWSAPVTRPSAKTAFSFHVFSKHLQFLDYRTTAEVAAEIGFDGVDMAVRPGGHVLPESVEQDLPEAVQAIRSAGLQALMMTTAIADAQDKTQQQVLTSAQALGIQYYRTNWLHYPPKADVRQTIGQYRQQLKTLADLNRQLGIQGAYQNHAGSDYVGAAVWDLSMALQDADPAWLGIQYDIRHATVEGGYSWPLGLNLIHPYINSLAVKDFRWEKVKDRWQVVDTPLGEGMVDFPQFFSLLKTYGIAVPVSLHYEYAMPEHNTSLTTKEKIRETIRLMKKDLHTLKQYMHTAGLL